LQVRDETLSQENKRVLEWGCRFSPSLRSCICQRLSKRRTQLASIWLFWPIELFMMLTYTDRNDYFKNMNGLIFQSFKKDYQYPESLDRLSTLGCALSIAGLALTIIFQIATR
jgi:hypothetical protein